MDAPGLSAVCPWTLCELPRATLLTRPHNQDCSCLNISSIEETATLRYKKMVIAEVFKMQLYMLLRKSLIAMLGCKNDDHS